MACKAGVFSDCNVGFVSDHIVCMLESIGLGPGAKGSAFHYNLIISKDTMSEWYVWLFGLLQNDAFESIRSDNSKEFSTFQQRNISKNDVL